VDYGNRSKIKTNSTHCNAKHPAAESRETKQRPRQRGTSARASGAGRSGQPCQSGCGQSRAEYATGERRPARAAQLESAVARGERPSPYAPGAWLIGAAPRGRQQSTGAPGGRQSSDSIERACSAVGATRQQQTTGRAFAHPAANAERRRAARRKQFTPGAVIWRRAPRQRRAQPRRPTIAPGSE
jgi:hypothetical protein